MARRVILTKERIDKLKEAGFSESQARIVIVLRVFGKLTAREVRQHAHLHKQRTYEVLEQLQDLGVAVSVSTKPQQFSLLNPEESVRSFVDSKKKKLSEKAESIEQSFDSILDLLTSIPSVKHDTEDALFETVCGLRRISRVWRGMVKTAKKEVLIFASETEWLRLESGVLRYMVKRGVQVTAVVKPSDEELVKHLAGDGIKVIRRDPGFCSIVVDEHEMLISKKMIGGKRISKSDEECLALLTKFEPLIRPYFSYLDSLTTGVVVSHQRGSEVEPFLGVH